MISSEATSLIRRSGEGQRVSPLGCDFVFKAVTGETGGAFSLIECAFLPFQKGAPLHFHKVMTEAFYILEGSLTFTVDGETTEATPGTFLLVQPGMLHGFDNTSAESARFLILATPAGHENYFVDMNALIEAEGQWPPRDFQKLIATAERHDIYFKPASATQTA